MSSFYGSVQIPCFFIADNKYYEQIGSKTVDITDEIPFEIPQGWEWCRLGEIGLSNIGLTYKPTDISTEGIIVLRSSNIQNNKIDLNSNNVLVDFINTRKYFSYERDENGKLNKALRNGLRIRVECDIT